jgi:hypothetical protein
VLARAASRHSRDGIAGSPGGFFLFAQSAALGYDAATIGFTAGRLAQGVLRLPIDFSSARLLYQSAGATIDPECKR